MQPNQMTVQLAADEPTLGAKAGDRIKLALAPADVTVQEELDTFLAGFRPFGFCSDLVAPPSSGLVEKDTDQFRTFSSNNAFKQVEVETSLQAKVKEVDPETTLATYQVVERALGSFIPAVTQAQAAPLYDPQVAASRRIGWALALDREIRVWDLLTTAANWDANNVETIVGGQEWDAAGDPITDLQQRVEASNQPITDIWMSPLSSHAFIKNTNVRDHIRQFVGDGTPGANTDEGAFAQDIITYVIPGLPPIHVCPAKKLNETTGNLDYVLSDDVVLTKGMGGLPTSGEDIVTIQTFRREGPNGTGVESREFFVEDRGMSGGTMLVQGHAEDVKFISNTCGGLIKNTRA